MKKQLLTLTVAAVSTIGAAAQTAPAAPASLTARATGLRTVELDVTPNRNNDQVMVVAATRVDRSAADQPAWVGTPEGDYAVGDEVLGGGKVVAIGSTFSSSWTVSVDNASSPYYFVAFSYDPASGLYSTETAQADTYTYIEVPYKADFKAMRTGCLPPSWTQSVAGAFGVTADNVLACTVPAGQGGTERSFTMSPVVVDAWYGARVEITYALASGGAAYNDWASGAYLRLKASTDGGQTFTDVTGYTASTRPQQTAADDYKTLNADLSAFEGKNVELRLEWLCGNAPADVTLSVSGISVWAGEAPEVPVVRLAEVGEDFALVEWRTSLATVELNYRAAGDDSWVMIELSNASQARLNDLTPDTEYEVYLRGAYPDWKYTGKSEVLTFVTGAWGAVAAPRGQSVDLSDFINDGSVTFMWVATDEMTSYEVRYRKVGETDYTTVSNLVEPRCVVRDLAADTRYEWSVRANCTHGRVTEWSDDVDFSTPALGGITALESALAVTAADGCVTVTNTAGVTVERVTVTDMTGRVIADRAVGAPAGVVLPVGHAGVVVVTVVTPDGTTRVKTVL